MPCNFTIQTPLRIRNFPASSQWPMGGHEGCQFLSSLCLTVAHPPSTIASLPCQIVTPFTIGLAKFHLAQPISIFLENFSLAVYSSPWWWQYALLERLSTSTRLHGAMSQKTAISMPAIVKTWNLARSFHCGNFSGTHATRVVWPYKCRRL
jgi:hypothetical protein